MMISEAAEWPAEGTLHPSRELNLKKPCRGASEEPTEELTSPERAESADDSSSHVRTSLGPPPPAHCQGPV